MKDEEIEKILNKILREILSKSMEKKAEEKKGILPPLEQHGIYVYRNGEWVLYRKDGSPLQLGELGDGIYVVYFDNSKCPACRMYDPIWSVFVEKNKDKAFLIIVLCEWFSRRCASKAASLSFLLHGVKASPTTLFARVIDGKVVEQKVIEGVSEVGVLEEYLNKMLVEG